MLKYNILKIKSNLPPYNFSNTNLFFDVGLTIFQGYFQNTFCTIDPLH